MSPCARATRGLRKPSLDARRGDSSGPSLSDNVYEHAWRNHLYSLVSLAWGKALPWAKRLSWHTQGERVK